MSKPQKLKLKSAAFTLDNGSTVGGPASNTDKSFKEKMKGSKKLSFNPNGAMQTNLFNQIGNTSNMPQQQMLNRNMGGMGNMGMGNMGGMPMMNTIGGMPMNAMGGMPMNSMGGMPMMNPMGGMPMMANGMGMMANGMGMMNNGMSMMNNQQMNKSFVPSVGNINMVAQPPQMMNFANMNSNSNLSLKLKQRIAKKDTSEVEAVKKTETKAPASAPVEVKETPKVEEVKQQEAVVVKEEAPVQEKVAAPVEDLSKLPQERPKVMMYSKDMILKYLETANPVTIDEDGFDTLEDLRRDIQEIKQAENNYGGGGYNRRDDRRRGGDYGRKNNKYGEKRTNYSGGGGGGGYDRRDDRRRNNDRHGGGNRGYGDRYGDDKRRRDNNSGMNRNAPLLQRQVMSKETMERLKNLKDEMKDQGGIIEDKHVDEEDALRKEISLKLLQLAPESLQKVLKDLQQMCQEYDVCQIIVEMVIVRAWSQQKYSKLYADLISLLGNNEYTWAEGEAGTKGKLENGKKKFKSLVIQKIKKEFLDGFNNFKNKMIKLDGDKNRDSDDRFNSYNKAKKKLKGNINFISDLYLIKYLPHKVIRFICYKLTLEFTKESIKFLDEEEIGTLQTPMHEEYVEALIDLLSNSGHKIGSREKKLAEKTPPSADNHSYMKALAQHLVKHFQIRSFTEESVPTVIPDEERRNMNSIDYSFQFMEQGKEAKIFGIRLSLLITNLIEQRHNGWEKKFKEETAKTKEEVQKDYEQEIREKDRGSNRSRYHDDYDRGSKYDRRRERRDDDYERLDRRRGNRDGGRRRNAHSSRFDESPENKPKRNTLKSTNTFQNLAEDDDDDEYEYVSKKETGGEEATEVNLEDVGKQFKSFFDANSKETDPAHIQEFFSKKNVDFKKMEYAEMLKLYLTHFTSGWEGAVLMRAEYAQKLFEEFEGDLETFQEVFQECYEADINSDLPSYKKAYAILLSKMIEHQSFKVEDLVIDTSTGDVGKDYGIAEGYQGLFSQLKDIANSNPELGKSLADFSQDKEDFFGKETEIILARN